MYVVAVKEVKKNLTVKEMYNTTYIDLKIFIVKPNSIDSASELIYT